MINEQDILNAHILIVDDLEANVISLKELLQETGYLHLSSTMNPGLVGELHRANRYDLILLNLNMPDMDGLQMVAQLTSNDRDDYLPILAITTQANHQLLALAAGAKDFIVKPFDITEVNSRIRNLLEVRLLYKKLEEHNQVLEQTVLERTAELRASQARYRSLIELASDWYWEQDEHGHFTQVSGPVREMLGIQSDPLDSRTHDVPLAVWNEVERAELRTRIADRQPFLDFIFSRVNADGSQQQFQVSGEPMFNQSSRFIGYRGIGVEISIKNNASI